MVGICFAYQGFLLFSGKVLVRAEQLNNVLAACVGQRCLAKCLCRLVLPPQGELPWIGTILLLNALERAYMVCKNVAIYGVALRSLNDRTTKLYQRYGFVIVKMRSTPL